jgi:hypothetical protein
LGHEQSLGSVRDRIGVAATEVRSCQSREQGGVYEISWRENASQLPSLPSTRMR